MDVAVNSPGPYVHGFSPDEQARLRQQAEFAAFTIFRDVDFIGAKRLLEIGSGVGAQTAILLRRFPDLTIDCVEINELQIEAAHNYLSSLPYAAGRFTIHKMNALSLAFAGRTFDGGFLCWVLEHVADPAGVLREVRRVVKPNGSVIVNEVVNSSFVSEPYLPHTQRYWMAFNDFQRAIGGDPFVGVRLGNLLQAQGFRGISSQPKIWHFDHRESDRRLWAFSWWKELLLSAKDQLLAAGRIDSTLVSAMEEEFAQVEAHPNSAFFYAFMQARAEVV